MAKKATATKTDKTTKVDTKSKDIAKADKTKKQPAKKQAKASASAGNESKLLELGLICDVTGSMQSWIDRAKDTLKQIIQNVQDSCADLKVKVCFVGYRDHGDQDQYEVHDFTDNLDQIKSFIAKVKADGGGDCPEDVTGGLRRCLDQNWTAGSSRQAFFIADAPAHGS